MTPKEAQDLADKDSRLTDDEIFLLYYNREFAGFFGPFDPENGLHSRLKEDIGDSLGYSTFRLNARLEEFQASLLPGVPARMRWWICYVLYVALMIIVINFAETLVNIVVKLLN